MEPGPHGPFHYGPGNPAAPVVGEGQDINYYPPPHRPQLPPRSIPQEPIYESVPVPLPYYSHNSSTQIPSVKARNLPPPPLPPRQAPVVGTSQYQVQQSHTLNPPPSVQAPASHYDGSAYPQGQSVNTGHHSPSSYHLSTPGAYSPLPLPSQPPPPDPQPQYSSYEQTLRPQSLYHPNPSPLTEPPKQDVNIHSVPPPPQQQPTMTQNAYYPQAAQSHPSPSIHGDHHRIPSQHEIPVQQQQTTQDPYYYPSAAQSSTSHPVSHGSYYPQDQLEPQIQHRDVKEDFFHYPHAAQGDTAPPAQGSTLQPAAAASTQVAHVVSAPSMPVHQVEVSSSSYQPSYHYQPPAPGQPSRSDLASRESYAQEPNQSVTNPNLTYNPEPQQYVENANQSFPSDAAVSNNVPASKEGTSSIPSDLTKHFNEFNIRVDNASNHTSSLQSDPPPASAPEPISAVEPATRRKPVGSLTSNT